MLKHIFLYSSLQPIESTELILSNDKIELTDPALARLVDDAKLSPLPTDMNENTDPNDNMLKSENNDNIEYTDNGAHLDA